MRVENSGAQTERGFDFSTKQVFVKLLESKLPPPGMGTRCPNYDSKEFYSALADFLRRNKGLAIALFGDTFSIVHVGTVEAISANVNTGNALLPWLKGHSAYFTVEDADRIERFGLPNYAKMASVRQADGIAPMGDHAGIIAARGGNGAAEIYQERLRRILEARGDNSRSRIITSG